MRASVMVLLEVEMDDFTDPSEGPREAVMTMVAEGNFEIINIEAID